MSPSLAGPTAIITGSAHAAAILFLAASLFTTGHMLNGDGSDVTARP